MQASSKGNKRGEKFKRILANDKDGNTIDNFSDDDNNHEERKKMKQNHLSTLMSHARFEKIHLLSNFLPLSNQTKD